MKDRTYQNPRYSHHFDEELMNSAEAFVIGEYCFDPFGADGKPAEDEMVVAAVIRQWVQEEAWGEFVKESQLEKRMLIDEELMNAYVETEEAMNEVIVG